MIHLFDFIPLPFTMNEYIRGVLEAQTSIKLVVFAHVPTVIVSLALAIFLYKKTKQLSAFYLLLLTIMFALWSYGDFVSWTSNTQSVMFTWSLLDMFNALFSIFAYWFLYVFVRGKDLPTWQKLVSLIPVVPIYVYTTLSINFDTFFGPWGAALENEYTNLYSSTISVIFLILIILFSVVSYTTESDMVAKKKIALGGLGIASFLGIFGLTFLVTNIIFFLSPETSDAESFAYNISTYALFGMPTLTGFLAYLIAKYQAFDIKLLKTVGLIIILQLLLFITIFI